MKCVTGNASNIAKARLVKWLLTIWQAPFYAWSILQNYFQRDGFRGSLAYPNTAEVSEHWAITSYHLSLLEYETKESVSLVLHRLCICRLLDIKWCAASWTAMPTTDFVDFPTIWAVVPQSTFTMRTTTPTVSMTLFTDTANVPLKIRCSTARKVPSLRLNLPPQGTKTRRTRLNSTRT